VARPSLANTSGCAYMTLHVDSNHPRL
jgi:hypothetical protein